MWLLWILYQVGFYGGEVATPYLTSFKFKVLLLLEWLATKAREPSLLFYLTHFQRYLYENEHKNSGFELATLIFSLSLLAITLSAYILGHSVLKLSSFNTFEYSKKWHFIADPLVFLAGSLGGLCKSSQCTCFETYLETEYSVENVLFI